ncbi:MAG: arginine repressor [Ruminococcaceae bacterium]|jgi:transcriptional regulator of arginine metabolism|nr:arginine repressor [Oscillospiraceae bacterium]
MTKSNRLMLIKDIVENNTISTQQDLMNYLSEHGFEITQATVSRDMKELGLTKALNENGVYCYRLPKSASTNEVISKFRRIFRESVISLKISGNIVIIKCFTGMGNAACEALDIMEFEQILGTIAGDNTIFAVVESADKGEELISELNKLLGV